MVYCLGTLIAQFCTKMSKSEFDQAFNKVANEDRYTTESVDKIMVMIKNMRGDDIAKDIGKLIKKCFEIYPSDRPTLDDLQKELTPK